MKSTLLFFAILLLAIPFSVKAQVQPAVTDTQLYVVTKIDGTEYIGKILSDDGREVLVETQSLGKIFIPKSDIRSIVKVKDGQKEIVNGEYQNAGPFTTRYCFTTNALPIQKGENYALINLYGPEVHFALSDRFSLGFMSTWIASPMVLAAKYSIPTKNPNVNFSIGTLIGTSGYLNQFKGFGGLHFANVTLGDRKKNITFSAGYAYMKSGGQEYGTASEEGVRYDTVMDYNAPYYYEPSIESSLVRGPIFSVAGISKVGTRASFVFDSMIGVFFDSFLSSTITTIRPYDYNLGIAGIYKTETVLTNRKTIALFIMPGMRFQTTERKAFQVSLAGASMFRDGNARSFPMPMCSWFYKF